MSTCSTGTGYPPIFRVRQHFEAPRVGDVAATVEAELRGLKLAARLRPGESVAITAGSRGIANIALILRATVAHLRSIGAEPFIVPAMGSHGGGTVEGQVGILHDFGITEQYVGCPIRASMQTVVICQAAEGFPVHFDRTAYEADHVLVCGRVKPHTGFSGEIESGLMKMMLIGLGKHEGAKVYHRAIQDFSFGRIVRSVSGHVLKQCRILAGLGIVENGYDQTALIRAVAPGEMEEREKELLVLAKRWMPRLPFDKVDVLVVDEIGKNISGTGLDTNVVGRKQEVMRTQDIGASGEVSPVEVRRIIIRSLTEATHGNACGLGIAEFCRADLVRNTDLAITAINTLTGGHPEGGRIPLAFETDRELFDAALSVVGLVEPVAARMLWIRNTLQVAEVECSQVYFDEARQRNDLEILTEPRPWPLDAQGNLTSFADFSASG